MFQKKCNQLTFTTKMVYIGFLLCCCFPFLVSFIVYPKWKQRVSSSQTKLRVWKYLKQRMTGSKFIANCHKNWPEKYKIRILFKQMRFQALNRPFLSKNCSRLYIFLRMIFVDEIFFFDENWFLIKIFNWNLYRSIFFEWNFHLKKIIQRKKPSMKKTI